MIENQQKYCYLMSWSTPGTLCLRTRSALGTLYLSAGVLKKLIQLYLGFLSTLGIQIKKCPESSGSSDKEVLVWSGTSNNNLFTDFQLSMAKNCNVFPQKFQHKNERPILPLRSGISYKPIGITVRPWHNIEHALWIL